MRRVLVVDDDPDAREAMSLLLERWGYDVDGAASAQEAIDKCAACRPDLIVLDLGLPVVPGEEVARALRQGGDRTTFIVALSGWGTDEHRRRAFEAGCDAYLLKPADLDELQRLLANPRSDNA